MKANLKTFMPFFSENYAKLHQSDLFEYPYELLVESTLQVTLGLETTNEDFSAKWQSLLCSYFTQESASFVHKHIKQLLLKIGKGKTGYHTIRDTFTFQTNFSAIQALSMSTDGMKTMSYQDNIQLLQLLSTITTVATRRPHSWQQFCVDNPAFVLLYDFSFHLGLNKEAILLIVKLLSLSIPVNSNLENVPTDRVLPSSKTGIVDTFLNNRLATFVDLFLLAMNLAEIRKYSQVRNDVIS
jgi:hypothetical protein